jgi:hypothetical protein
MWKEKMRLLKDITPQSNHYSTEVKLSMLQNAVSIVPNLSSIRDISESQRGSTVLPSATA